MTDLGSEPSHADQVAPVPASAREAAMRQILEIIRRSRDDDQPVFDAILESAARLCQAPMAMLLLANASRTRMFMPASFGEALRSLSVDEDWELDPDLAVAPDTRHQLNQTIIHKQTLQTEDLSSTAGYRDGNADMRRLVDEEGLRTRLTVPLISGGEGIGCIVLCRREVAPFDDADVALIETFAEQAVIAIQNVRQFRDLKTRFEREAATREILSVISRSRDDETPVFRTILENAARLCQAPHALLLMRDETDSVLELVANNSAESAFIDNLRDTPHDLSNKNSAAVLALDSMITQHVPDVRTLFPGQDRAPQLSVAADVEGMRTVLLVPLVIRDRAVGVLSVYKLEVAPFSESEIALVETFAEQAVIAIENVRQFREVQERLEREAATRQILEVISRSRDDERPVFDAILENASRLCHTKNAYLLLRNEADTHLEFVAQSFLASGLKKLVQDHPYDLTDANSLTIQTLHAAEVCHVHDVIEREEINPSPQLLMAIRNEGIRTLVMVPLMKHDRAIGLLGLYKHEVAPFRESEIELVQTFAAQAVIAIENVRQFREVQERLDRERASREVMQVISASRADSAPVFDVILRNASHLSGAPLANLCLLNDAGSHWHLVAHFGEGLRHLTVGTTPRPLQSELVPAVAMRTARVVHIENLTETDLYRQRDPGRVAMVEVEGMRTILCVPLLSDGRAVGCITLFRREVRAFSGDEIALVETFAAQAVIAIENVRQFRALEERTQEVEALNAGLESRVAAQVDEIERMGRLKRFLSPQVADAVVSAGDEALLKSHRALIAVLFCDIRGFTAFCESAEPEETIEFLQSYHETMGQLIGQAGAGFDHRSGDGIMVVFNDPIPCDDPAGEAVRLAAAMRDRMQDLCRDWRKLGHRLGFGVGIALGYATVGMVGFEGRYDYTASGNVVNLASRLCDHAQDQDILVSSRAAVAVEDMTELEPAGDLTLKGFAAPVSVLRVKTIRGQA